MAVVESELPKRRAPKARSIPLSDEEVAGIYRNMDLRGWSQQRLAREAEISSATVNYMLNKHRASSEVLKKVGRAFAESRVDKDIADILRVKIG